MEKERGKKYFLTKAIQCLFLFCSPWKVLTALGTTKQFTTGMWKKFDSTWNSFRVFFLQCMKRIFEKKNSATCQPKMHYPKLSGELAVSRGVCYHDTNLWQTSRYSDKAVCKESWQMPIQGSLSFYSLTLSLSIWEQKNFPKPVHA